MKKLILLIAITILGSCGYAHAQTETVCISREAAVKALENADTVKAQADELKAKDQAIDDLKKIIVDLKVSLAQMSGEKTQLEADRVRWSAILDLLIKSARAKKNGLINF
jgi:hypothetical protein